MTFLVSITVLIAFLVSTYGWGRIVVPLFYREAPRSWPYIVALGLCVLVVIGGGLNLLHIARPSALEVLSGLGLGSALIFTLLAIWRDPARFGPRGLTHRLRQWPWRGISLGDAVPWLVIAGATAFFIAYLLPAAAFNFHDDFHKYFVAPIRMLQTGSLGGGPFEVVGRDHLGTQSFLQAFILTRFEPVFINGFDYIFCFLLAGLVLNDLGRKLELHWFYRTIAVLCLVLINPQYVNISALYSSVLLILATAYAALLFAEVVEAGEFRTLAGAAVPVGLFLACLISLKSTFIGFTLILGAMLAVGFLWDRAHRRQIITAYGAALIAAAVVLVPWSVISENNLVGTIGRVLGRIRGTSMGGGGGDLTDWGRLGDLFLSRQDLFYGGWLPGYNAAILSVLAAALVSGALLWHNREQNIRRHLVVLICFTLAAVLAYLLNVYLFAVKVGRIDITIRYFTPILIATLPLAVLALGQAFWRFRPLPPGAMAPNSVGAVALLALFVLVAGLFAQPFTDRAAQMNSLRLIS